MAIFRNIFNAQDAEYAESFQLRVLCVKNIRIPLAVFLCTLSACFSSPVQLPDNAKLDSFSIYLARSSLMQTEFEQFKFGGTKLFYECGEIKRGRHSAKLQNIVTIPSENLQQILTPAYQYQQAASESEVRLASPGGADSFFDPGQARIEFAINSDQISINTSLDELSEPSGKAQRKLARFVTSVRAFAREASGDKPLCDNREFYGLSG